MRSQFLPYALPDTDEAEIAAVADTIRSGWLTTGPKTRQFEAAFAAAVGAPHAVAVNSCTAAMHLALEVIGLRAGDEVITTPYTFAATAEVIRYFNARPVFVDVDPATLNMNPALLEAAVTERTRAILPVHIAGLPADLDAISSLARRHNLPVIEDAAQAHGATYKGRKVGSIGDLGCFSFQGSKNLPAGEGGILVTSREDLKDRANRFRMFGEDIRESDKKAFDASRPLDGAREYNSLMLGWMYRGTELTAALCRSQLKRLDASLAQTRRNAAYLTEHLAKIPGVRPPFVPPDCMASFYQYRIRLDGAALGIGMPVHAFRTKLMAALKAEGVEVSLWQTVPVPAQTLFQERTGYGLSCPWKCPLGEEVKYDVSEYPETLKLLEDSLTIGSHSFPLFPQPIELMQAYVTAFQRVFDHLDQVVV